MNFSSVWQGQIVPYLPMLKHIVLPSLAFATAVVATIMVVVKSRCAARPFEKWTTADDEVDEFLDWREFDAKAQAEQVAREEAERLVCGECSEEYAASEGHECVSVACEICGRDRLVLNGKHPATGQTTCRKPPPKLVPIPPVGPIAARPVKEPLFDRVYLKPTLPPEAPAPIVTQGQSAVYSVKEAVNPHCIHGIHINIPYGGFGSEFRVTGLSVWSEDRPTPVPDVRVYSGHDNFLRHFPAQIIWSRDGKMALDAPIIMPRATQIRFEVTNDAKARDVVVAIHGTWYTVENPPAPAVDYGPSYVKWFTHGVGQIDPNDPEKRPKTEADTTTYGWTPLPQGHQFYWYEIEAIPDEGSDPDDVRELKNRGAFKFQLAQTNYRTFLGNEVIGAKASVTVSDKPFIIQALENFCVSLATDGMKIKKGMWVKILLRGIKMRPLCG